MKRFLSNPIQFYPILFYFIAQRSSIPFIPLLLIRTNNPLISLLSHHRIEQRLGSHTAERSMSRQNHRFLPQRQNQLLNRLLHQFQATPIHSPLHCLLRSLSSRLAHFVAHQRVSSEQKVPEVIAQRAWRVSRRMVHFSLMASHGHFIHVLQVFDLHLEEFKNVKTSTSSSAVRPFATMESKSGRSASLR